MPKTGANIYKRKDGRWEGRYIKGRSEDGKAKYGYVYSKTYSEVRLKLNEKTLEAAADKHRRPNEEILFSEISEKWLNSVQHRVKESTLSAYKNTLERHILPDIGEYRLKNLSDDILKIFAEEKMSNGKVGGGGLSPKSVRDILSIINSVIEYAEDERHIPRGKVSVKYPKKNPQIMRVLSKEEQARLEAVLLNKTDIFKFGVLVCLYTGLRIGEICALRWSDISLSDGIITVRKTLQRIKNIDSAMNENKTKVIIDELQSGCYQREIPIPIFLVSGFKRFYSGNQNAFFLTESETNFIEPRTYQNRLKAYLRESGIADASFNSLRDTFSIRCVELEFDIKQLSEILGHSDVNTTLNRYAPSSFELKRQNMMKLRLVSG